LTENLNELEKKQFTENSGGIFEDKQQTERIGHVDKRPGKQETTTKCTKTAD